MGIGSAIRNLFGGDDSPQDSKKRGRRGPRRGAAKVTQPRVTTVREMEAKLSRMITQGSSMHAGQIQLLGLEEIKERLGEAWPKLEKRVKSAARAAIEHHLARQDFYFERSDMEYLIVFAAKTVDQAKLTSGQILDSLLQKFSGDHEMKDIVVHTAVGQTDGKLNFDSKPLDVVVQTTRAERTDLKLSRPGSTPGKPSTAATSRPAPSRPAGGATPKAGAASRAPEKHPTGVQKALSGVRPHSVSSTPHASLRRPVQRIEPAPKPESSETELPAGKLNIQFKPVWDSAREGVTAFAADVAFEANGKRISGYCAATRGREGVFVRQLDREILDTLSSILRANPTAAPQPHLIVPVHYESVHNARVGSDYVRQCREKLAKLNHKIVFALNALPNGLPSWRLVEIISSLRPMSINVAAIVEPDNANVAVLSAAGLLMLGMYIDTSAMPHSRDYDKFRLVISTAGRAGMHTMLFGVDEAAPGLFAVTSDAKFISGGIIADTSPLPRSAYILKKDALVQKCAVECKRLADEGAYEDTKTAKSV